jgi:hypothetical protein
VIQPRPKYYLEVTRAYRIGGNAEVKCGTEQRQRGIGIVNVQVRGQVNDNSAPGEIVA